MKDRKCDWCGDHYQACSFDDGICEDCFDNHATKCVGCYALLHTSRDDVYRCKERRYVHNYCAECYRTHKKSCDYCTGAFQYPDESGSEEEMSVDFEYDPTKTCAGCSSEGTSLCKACSKRRCVECSSLLKVFDATYCSKCRLKQKS